MRKSDREIRDYNEILRLLDECQTIRLALHDEPYPYVVPLSYGWEERDGKLFVYFHCAKEGKKLDLIEKNGNVCFEADCLAGLQEHRPRRDPRLQEPCCLWQSRESLRRRTRSRT